MSSIITPEMSSAADFEAVIRRERSARGLGPTEFAKLIGVSRPSLAAYETRGQVPKLGQAAVIARRLGLTLDQLAGVEPLPDRSRELEEAAEVMRDAAKAQEGIVISLRDAASRLQPLAGQDDADSETG